MYLSTTVLAEKLLLCQFGDKKCLFLTLGLLISKLGTLEIKPCGLSLEFKIWGLKVITGLISWLIFISFW